MFQAVLRSSDRLVSTYKSHTPWTLWHTFLWRNMGFYRATDRTVTQLQGR